MKDLQQHFILEGKIEELMEEEKRIQQLLNERYSQEEILWRQKSRVQWLKEGERNTSFFHRTMIQRCHSNRIHKLKDNHGLVLNKHQDIQAELIN